MPNINCIVSYWEVKEKIGEEWHGTIKNGSELYASHWAGME